MAITTKEILKSWFETNDIPTEEQFANLIDSIQAPINNDNPLFELIEMPDGSNSLKLKGFDSHVRTYFIEGNGDFPEFDIWVLAFGDVTGPDEWNFIPRSAIWVLGEDNSLCFSDSIRTDQWGYPGDMETFKEELWRFISDPTYSTITGAYLIDWYNKGSQFFKNLAGLYPRRQIYLEDQTANITEDSSLSYIRGIGIKERAYSVDNWIATRNKKYDYVVTPANWKTILATFINNANPTVKDKSILFTNGTYEIKDTELQFLYFKGVILMEGESSNVILNISISQATVGFYINFGDNICVNNIQFKINKTGNNSVSNLECNIFRNNEALTSKWKFERCKFNLTISDGVAHRVKLFGLSTYEMDVTMNCNLEDCDIYVLDQPTNIVNNHILSIFDLGIQMSPENNSIFTNINNCRIVAETTKTGTTLTTIRNLALFNNDRLNIKVTNSDITTIGRWQGSIFFDVSFETFKVRDCRIIVRNHSFGINFAVYRAVANNQGEGSRKNSYFRDSFIGLENTYAGTCYLYAFIADGVDNSYARTFFIIDNVRVYGSTPTTGGSFVNMHSVTNCLSPLNPNGNIGYTNCYSNAFLHTSTYSCAATLNGGWNETRGSMPWNSSF